MTSRQTREHVRVGENIFVTVAATRCLPRAAKGAVTVRRHPVGVGGVLPRGARRAA